MKKAGNWAILAVYFSGDQKPFLPVYSLSFQMGPFPFSLREILTLSKIMMIFIEHLLHLYQYLWRGNSHLFSLLEARCTNLYMGGAPLPGRRLGLIRAVSPSRDWGDGGKPAREGSRVCLALSLSPNQPYPQQQANLPVDASSPWWSVFIIVTGWVVDWSVGHLVYAFII